jgi:hypothetical protein
MALETVEVFHRFNGSTESSWWKTSLGEDEGWRVKIKRRRWCSWVRPELDGDRQHRLVWLCSSWEDRSVWWRDERWGVGKRIRKRGSNEVDVDQVAIRWDLVNHKLANSLTISSTTINVVIRKEGYKYSIRSQYDSSDRLLKT